MATLLRLLHPAVYLRRKAIYAGLLGGSRKWLIWGGAAWVLHTLRNLLGEGKASPVHIEELDAGERFVILHKPAPSTKSRRARRRA